jgi:hypothetical protein
MEFFELKSKNHTCPEIASIYAGLQGNSENKPDSSDFSSWISAWR